MSLILLSAVESFTARDIAGRALPLATLDFFVAGTSEPADVGDDDGHFEADADGIFPEITLGLAESYRVVLKTADGVLVYDVDPYVCTCGEEGEDGFFRSPIQRAFDADDRIAPGAKLYSFAADGETPEPLYADAALTAPLPNPIVANAAGVFASPIYSDDETTYVLELRDAAGNLLDEFDPYVCSCVGPSEWPVSFTDADSMFSDYDGYAFYEPVQNPGVIDAGTLTEGGWTDEQVVAAGEHSHFFIGTRLGSPPFTEDGFLIELVLANDPDALEDSFADAVGVRIVELDDTYLFEDATITVLDFGGGVTGVSYLWGPPIANQFVVGNSYTVELVEP